MGAIREINQGALEDRVYFYAIFFTLRESRRAPDPALPRICSSLYYDFTLGALPLKPSSFCNDRVKVQPLAPNHFSGIIKPKTVSATTKADGLDYKYSANIEFKADVNWHPRPRTEPEPVAETVEERMPQNEHKRLIRPTGNTTKWEQMVNEKGVVVAFVSLVVYAFCSAALLIAGKGTTMKPSTTSIPPFIYKIDHRNVSREA